MDTKQIIEYNKKITDSLPKIEVAVVMNDMKFTNNFVEFIFKILNHNIPILPQTKEVVKKLLNHILSNYIQYISKNIGPLNIWYALSYLSNETEQENNDTDKLFYEIFIQIQDNRSIFFFLKSFIEMFKSKSYSNIIENLLNQRVTSSIDENFIFKLVYFIIHTKGMSKDLEPLYAFIKEYFENGIKKKSENLLFYLYQPLLFVHNGIKLTQKDFEKFNNEIEKQLESYIQNKLIPKYKIQPNNKKYNNNKIAFVVDRISDTSIHKVFYSFLKKLIKDSPKLHIYIYDINYMETGGSESSSVSQIQELPVKYIDCHQKFVGNKNPIYSIVKKSIAIRKHIISEKIDTLVMQNGRAEATFLFTTRTAKKQIFWSHGNFAYDVVGIDKRICHFHNYKNKNFDFEVIQNEIDIKKYNPQVNIDQVDRIRKNYPQESFILGSIGRLIKIESDEYLETVAKIMEENPNTIFLACGSGNQEKIKMKIKELNILDRFYFTGHIDSHIYGHVIDLYLDPFPLGGGEGLMEYRGKGKPYVSLHSEEWFFSNQNYIQKCIQENKVNEFLKESLYKKEYLQNISLKNFLIKENKKALIYSEIPIVLNIDEYIAVVNKLIIDIELCDKIGEEQIYLMSNKINNEILL